MYLMFNIHISMYVDHHPSLSIARHAVPLNIKTEFWVNGMVTSTSIPREVEKSLLLRNLLPMLSPFLMTATIVAIDFNALTLIFTERTYSTVFRGVPHRYSNFAEKWKS